MRNLWIFHKNKNPKIMKSSFVLFILRYYYVRNTITRLKGHVSESGDFCLEKSKRSVVDHAKLGVFYELKFRKDFYQVG